MGNRISSQDHLQQSQAWVEHSQLMDTPGTPFLLVSKQNPYLHAERYSTYPFPENLQNQISKYKTRRTPHNNLVEVLSLSWDRSPKTCSTISKIEVITERLPFRLFDLKSTKLNEHEVIYVLKGVLFGYQVLYRHKISCYIDSKMIAFNQKAEVKVWIHDNWSINSPLLKGYSESSTVGEIINTVFDFCESSKRNPVYEEIVSTKQYRFAHILSILENYIIDEELCCRSLIQKFDSKGKCKPVADIFTKKRAFSEGQVKLKGYLSKVQPNSSLATNEESRMKRTFSGVNSNTSWNIQINNILKFEPHTGNLPNQVFKGSKAQPISMMNNGGANANSRGAYSKEQINVSFKQVEIQNKIPIKSANHEFLSDLSRKSVNFKQQNRESLYFKTIQSRSDGQKRNRLTPSYNTPNNQSQNLRTDSYLSPRVIVQSGLTDRSSNPNKSMKLYFAKTPKEVPYSFTDRTAVSSFSENSRITAKANPLYSCRNETIGFKEENSHKSHPLSIISQEGISFSFFLKKIQKVDKSLQTQQSDKGEQEGINYSNAKNKQYQEIKAQVASLKTVFEKLLNSESNFIEGSRDSLKDANKKSHSEKNDEMADMEQYNKIIYSQDGNQKQSDCEALAEQMLNLNPDSESSVQQGKNYLNLFKHYLNIQEDSEKPRSVKRCEQGQIDRNQVFSEPFEDKEEGKSQEKECPDSSQSILGTIQEASENEECLTNNQYSPRTSFTSYMGYKLV